MNKKKPIILTGIDTEADFLDQTIHIGEIANSDWVVAYRDDKTLITGGGFHKKDGKIITDDYVIVEQSVRSAFDGEVQNQNNKNIKAFFKIDAKTLLENDISTKEKLSALCVFIAKSNEFTPNKIAKIRKGNLEDFNKKSKGIPMLWTAPKTI